VCRCSNGRSARPKRSLLARFPSSINFNQPSEAKPIAQARLSGQSQSEFHTYRTPHNSPTPNTTPSPEFHTCASATGNRACNPARLSVGYVIGGSRAARGRPASRRRAAAAACGTARSCAGLSRAPRSRSTGACTRGTAPRGAARGWPCPRRCTRGSSCRTRLRLGLGLGLGLGSA
jgi:hypothetical protein